MEGICEALTDEFKELHHIHLKNQLQKQTQQQQHTDQPKMHVHQVKYITAMCTALMSFTIQHH